MKQSRMSGPHEPHGPVVEVDIEVLKTEATEHSLCVYTTAPINSVRSSCPFTSQRGRRNVIFLNPFQLDNFYFSPFEKTA